VDEIGSGHNKLQQDNLHLQQAARTAAPMAHSRAKVSYPRPETEIVSTRTRKSLMIKRVISSTGSGLAQLLGFEPCVNVPASHVVWATSHHGPYPETTCVSVFLRAHSHSHTTTRTIVQSPLCSSPVNSVIVPFQVEVDM
jgi:hypothetical protein